MAISERMQKEYNKVMDYKAAHPKASYFEAAKKSDVDASYFYLARKLIERKPTVQASTVKTVEQKLIALVGNPNDVIKALETVM